VHALDADATEETSLSRVYSSIDGRKSSMLVVSAQEESGGERMRGSKAQRGFNNLLSHTWMCESMMVAGALSLRGLVGRYS
jgi:hypothetical protein